MSWMESAFTVHLVLWLAALLVSSLLLVWFFSLLQRERQLPTFKQIEEKEKQKELIEHELERIRPELEEKRQIIFDAEEKQSWLSANQDELLRVQAEREDQERIRAELVRTQEELAGSRQQLEEVQAELTRFSELDSRREELVDQVEKLQSELNDLEGKTAFARQEWEAVNSKLAEARGELQVAITEAAEANRTVAELEVKAAGLRAEIKQIEDSREFLREQWNTLKESQHKLIEQIEKHWKNLEEHVKRSSDLIRDSLNSFAASANVEFDSRLRYKDLWEPVLSPDRFRGEGTERSEEEALDGVRGYLEVCGLRYSRRVVNAFHTSLKINDLSPLTVLAGISGTGKSLLPKRYAEGIGMNFLMVAVQPRWDSPQDLFGFYNYMERRYKATELARALVQMERYNCDDWEDLAGGRDISNLGDRMLLVLLDEMNLARVEYYFSELLSRLETRRSIGDLDDAAQRADAEIALEMGSLGEEEKSVRLLVDNNVIFVGTINEDESTQTLSDKVLDRADALRFGRPMNLVLEELPGTQEPEPCDEPLLFETWEEWFRSADELGTDRLARLDSWIGRLNDSMDLAGKPFGFRVSQAIRSYVANYPHALNNDDAFQAAFADQIEQRIMPKLRGLETVAIEEGLNQLESVMGEINDTELLNAFRSAHETEFFNWQGVNRDEA